MAIWITLAVLKVFGLYPFSVDKKSHRLKSHRFPLAYPIIFLISLYSTVIYCTNIVFATVKQSFVSEAINLALGLMFFTYTLAIIFTYVRTYRNLSVLESIFEDGVKIARVLDILKIRPNQSFKRLLTLFVVNFIVLPIFVVSVNYVRIAKFDSESHYFFILIIEIPNVIPTLLKGVFHGAMLMVFYIYLLLNYEIMEVMAKTNDMEAETQTAFRIQQQFCDLSDSLDAIAQAHLQLTLLAQRISDLVAFNLVMWMAYKMCGILLQLFSLYKYLICWMQMGGFKAPIQILETDIFGGIVWA